MTHEFDRFYQAEYQAILSTARARIPDWHRAEELAQEAFTLVYRTHDKAGYRGCTVYFTLRNLIGDEYRRRVIEQRHAALWAAPELPDHDSVDSTEAHELRSLVRTLPLLEREVVVLRFWADLSAQQISELLGCGASTVRMRLHRALRRLRLATSVAASTGAVQRARAAQKRAAVMSKACGQEGEVRGELR